VVGAVRLKQRTSKKRRKSRKSLMGTRIMTWRIMVKV
jgi:hypothetical protein